MDILLEGGYLFCISNEISSEIVLPRTNKGEKIKTLREIYKLMIFVLLGNCLTDFRPMFHLCRNQLVGFH